MLWLAVAVGAAAAIGLPIGCGREEQSASAKAEQCQSAKASLDEYLEVLCEFRAAALAHKTYDAYGHAEYMPAPQRAAIDAFCLLVDEPPDDLEAETLADSAYFADKLAVTARSEVDSGEADVGSTASLRKAIDKLQAILGTESFSSDLAEHYAKACY